VLGIVLDGDHRPFASSLWPCNAADAARVNAALAVDATCRQPPGPLVSASHPSTGRFLRILAAIYTDCNFLPRFVWPSMQNGRAHAAITDACQLDKSADAKPELFIGIL